MAWVEALEGGCGRERVPQPSVAELLEAAASKEDGLSGRHSHHYESRLQAMEEAAAEAERQESHEPEICLSCGA